MNFEGTGHLKQCGRRMGGGWKEEGGLKEEGGWKEGARKEGRKEGGRKEEGGWKEDGRRMEGGWEEKQICTLNTATPDPSQPGKMMSVPILATGYVYVRPFARLFLEVAARLFEAWRCQHCVERGGAFLKASKGLE
eukprot:Skav220873  [mRNA]  locus=scaffold2625:7027:11416:+ [translate_table: standard]